MPTLPRSCRRGDLLHRDDLLVRQALVASDGAAELDDGVGVLAGVVVACLQRREQGAGGELGRPRDVHAQLLAHQPQGPLDEPAVCPWGLRRRCAGLR